MTPRFNKTSFLLTTAAMLPAFHRAAQSHLAGDVVIPSLPSPRWRYHGGFSGHSYHDGFPGITGNGYGAIKRAAKHRRRANRCYSKR